MLRAIKAAFEYGIEMEGDEAGGSQSNMDKSCIGNTSRCFKGLSEPTNPMGRGWSCPCCEKPLKFVCGVCCCVRGIGGLCKCSEEGCGPRTILDKNDLESMDKQNERVRFWFECILYVMGTILVAFCFSFIIYAPICKPGSHDLVVLNGSAA